MFKVGDKVKLIDEVGEYSVQHIKGLYVVVIDEHGFEHEFAYTQLMPSRTLAVHEHVPLKKEDTTPPKISKPAKSKQKEKLEIDLHAGVLLGSTRGMTNHEIVTMQINEAEKSIKQARANGYTHVVLIHGKGTGKLRTELYKLLKRLERIEFYDADYRKFSSGATEVKFY